MFAPGNQFAPQNTYNLSITNTPVPVPHGLDLTDASDSGRASNDNVTNDNTPTVRIQLDEAPLAADVVSFSPTGDSNLADDNPGFKVQVLDNGSPAESRARSARVSTTSPPRPRSVRAITRLPREC